MIKIKEKQLTREQQEFWDILRMPYKKTCDNCFYHTPEFQVGAGCYDIIGRCDMNIVDQHPTRSLKWKWDEKNY